MSTCPYRLVAPDGTSFEPERHPLRADIPEPPERMQRLPIDERGYPVPFFVAWYNRKPEFRAANQDLIPLCIRRKLCWVCGGELGEERVFTVGSMCSINRVSSEPPAHRDCARYSARACPFLTKPHMVRREGDLPPGKMQGAGVSIRHNPGVTVLWFTRPDGFDVERHPGGFLWRFNRRPLGVEWYHQGRTATRAEVLAAIERGYPKLQEASRLDGSEGMLERWKHRAMALVPRA